MTKLLAIIAIILSLILPRTNPALSYSDNSPVSLSKNWSGYVSTGGKYTAVSATWDVPSVNSPASSDAIWVGIGGSSSRDLIQAGTDDIIDPSGNIQKSAFYEILPASAKRIPVMIKPGDSVTVSIKQTGTNNWLIKFKNNTTGGGQNIPLYYRSSLSSADWVVEALSTEGYELPLDNFKTVHFTNATATKNNVQVPAGQSNVTPIIMVINDSPAAEVTSVGPDQTSFTVKRFT